jgi:hypothetical protein
VVFGRRLRSGAEPEAAPVPLPWVLSRAHQALHETKGLFGWVVAMKKVVVGCEPLKS